MSDQENSRPDQNQSKNVQEKTGVERDSIWHELDWLFLVISTLAIIAARILTVSGQTVFLGGRALPEACMFKKLTGLKCATCGLTRSFVATAHGSWEQAWNFHHLGTLVFLLIAFQVPYRAICLIGRDLRLRWAGLERRASLTIVLIFAAGFLANWGLYLVTAK
ncbi:MAG: DUF2752 domain-containing protein [Planctomycetes bacterium]|nr:DUF2752 domain-containing protein [Planctomycetota bacterium]